MVTPAEVAEVLMRNEETDIALEGLIQFLKRKKDGAKDGKAENVDQALNEQEQEKETTMKSDAPDNQIHQDDSKE
jgi:hypothetical protein